MRKTPSKRRLLWIVNHQTLMAAEVPILRSLGWEVFIPKLVPDDVSYRSAGVSSEWDASLTLPPTARGKTWGQAVSAAARPAGAGGGP